VVPAQKMASSVRLLRLVVHNVKTTLNETTVGGDVIAGAVDSQSANRNVALAESIDLILSQCPRGRRTQFQLTGQDNGEDLHTIDTGTANCASLEDDIYYGTPPRGGKDKVNYRNDAALNCMAELLAGAEEVDLNHESFHVYIVKDLEPILNGFISSLAQGVVIREAEFNAAPSRVARLLLHEMGHGFNMGDRPTNECWVTPASGNPVMCSESPGTDLSVAECEKFYTGHPTIFRDHN
jgi:hypothetical protein